MPISKRIKDPWSFDRFSPFSFFPLPSFEGVEEAQHRWVDPYLDDSDFQLCQSCFLLTAGLNTQIIVLISSERFVLVVPCSIS